MSSQPTPDSHTYDPESIGSGDAYRGAVRLMRVAEHRQMTVFWCLAACLAIGVSYYAFAQRYYRSQAKLMVVEQRGSNVAGIADQADRDELMTTHKELVRSPVVIRRAIDQLLPEHRVDLIDEAPEDWVEVLGERLSATNTRKTNLIGVSYESLDPEAASAVVQAVINAYLSFVDDTHRGTASEVLEVLTVERDELERELASKQQLLRSERERVGHLELPKENGVVDPVIDRAIQVNRAWVDTRQRRVSLQASLASVEAAIRKGLDLRQYVGAIQDTVGERMMLSAMGLSESDMLVIADQQQRAADLKGELSRVRPFYGPNHPTVRSLRERLEETEQSLAGYGRGGVGRPEQLPSPELGAVLVNMLNQAIDQSAEQERRLQLTFEDARREASQQSGDLVRVDMLEREVDRLEKLHDVLFNKIAAVDIHQVQAPIRATIVEEPLPQDEPCSPQLRMVLAASLLGGLAIGIGLAYVQDLADDRFGSPEEMTAQLGCRVLAVVKRLPKLAGDGLETVHMCVNSHAADSEAFRTLRTSIALGADGADRFVVSSSEPGDGKTTISANLAVSYAQSGKRTLVIDSDLRKPGLTALLGLKGRPGLTDVLSCQSDLAAVAEKCVHRTSLQNLDVIPAGPRRPDPAELLLRANFGELLAWADGRYEQVLIDCPPVLAVSDAQIVGRLVDGVVLVVTPEKNHRRLVSRAVDSFAENGISLIGVVANRVSDTAGKGYGYGYGYGYGHDDSQSDRSSDDAVQLRPAA
ncbi:polysaccharide biosynthesis tyrosine autokinase [Botrimarina sp.]|uniref:GumC family protein n=1 Tax=Botrimarina sp. TaxID=2795802 RepID=UPI0032ED89FC